MNQTTVEKSILPVKRSFIKLFLFLLSLMAFMVLITFAPGKKIALLGYGCILLLLIILFFRGSIFSVLIETKPKPIHVALSTLFSITLGLNFYTMTLSTEITTLINSVHIQQKIVIILLTALGVLCAIPSLSMCLAYFSTHILEDMQVQKEKDALALQTKGLSMGRSVLLLCITYIIGISALLRANFNYIDDMGRAARGYQRWEPFSRFLSNSLSSFIHMNNYLTDISPLTQLIAIGILALSGILLLYIIYERTTFSLWELIALVPLVLNPYFLECISYKYDSPYMALSVLISIIPLLYRKKQAFFYIFLSMAGTAAMCMIYQASSGIYPLLVILLMLRLWYAKESFKNIIRFCCNSIIGYGMGMVFFKVFCMLPADTYVSNTLPGLKDFLPNFFNNLKEYYRLICSDFTPLWILLILIILAAFILHPIYHSKQKIITSLILTVFALCFMSILCFGAFPAFTAAAFSPRAMYGFGFLLTLLCISLMEGQQHMCVKTPVFLLSWAFFVFSFTYGNALYVQKEYTDFRITQVIDDLTHTDIFSGDAPITVQISGSIGPSPVLKNMTQKYPVLDRLVPITFKQDWHWGTYGFLHYYGLRNVVLDTSIDLTTFNLPPIQETMYHKISGNNTYVLIELK